jgi:hypothetical protein
MSVSGVFGATTCGAPPRMKCANGGGSAFRIVCTTNAANHPVGDSESPSDKGSSVNLLATYAGVLFVAGLSGPLTSLHTAHW